MSGKERHRDEPCFYCEALVRTTGRGDHFPVPKRNGGVLTVPICDTCHDMKDRFNLDDWPAPWITVVLTQWPILRRETRLFLAKTMSLLSDAIAMRKTPAAACITKDVMQNAGNNENDSPPEGNTGEGCITTASQKRPKVAKSGPKRPKEKAGRFCPPA